MPRTCDVCGKEIPDSQDFIVASGKTIHLWATECE